MAKNSARKKSAKKNSVPSSPAPRTSPGITAAAARLAQAANAASGKKPAPPTKPLPITPDAPRSAPPVAKRDAALNTPAAKASAVPAPAPTAPPKTPAPVAPRAEPAPVLLKPSAKLPAFAPMAKPATPPAKPAPAVSTPVAKPAPALPAKTPVAESKPAPAVGKTAPVAPAKPAPISTAPVPPPQAQKPAVPVGLAPAPAKGAGKRKGRAPKIDLASHMPSLAPTKRTDAPNHPLTASMTDRPRRICFISSECTPLAQTGGLGDVVAGLSKALKKRGHEVRIVMPLYGSIDRAKYGLTFLRSACVHFGRGEEIWVGIYQALLDDEVPVWFIDYDRYFGRPWLYDGNDEDAFRFAVLSKAAMQACKDTGFIPHVMHLHDWMSAPVAVLLRTWDRVLSPLSHTGSVLTIHNIGYQGKFHRSVLDFYGLSADEYLTPNRFEDFGAVNLLKAGIQYADYVTTVSPTYAREIREPIGGMGLGLYLNDRLDRVSGILNGVDTELWNPRTDKYLPARYSVEDMSGKAKCKRALQERLGLEVNPNIPIFGMISRFAPQKGFDLIRGALPQAMRDMVIQVVALGSGDPVTEDFFRWLQSAYPGRAHAYIGFSPELAHMIEAGSDFFLMPSYYEPCGLNQMYSSLYGTLPIVRATGGLDDTVENYNESTGDGTGFKFWDPTDKALFYTIGWAVATYFDRPGHYAAMQRKGMGKDFSWTFSARQYEDVYERAIAVHA
jgi:starch synthase